MEKQIKDLNTIEILKFKKSTDSTAIYRGYVIVRYRGFEFMVTLKKSNDNAWVEFLKQKKGNSYIPIISFVNEEEKYAFQNKLFELLKDRKPDEIVQRKGTTTDTSFLD